MYIYTTNDAANPARNYGTDAAQRFMADSGARFATHIEGPDSIGCYIVTFDNGLQLEISRTEQVATGFPVSLEKGVPVVLSGHCLNSRSAIKAWLANALRDNARRGVAAEIAATAKQAGIDADAAFNAFCAGLADLAA